jgi:uncharacterized Zn finger protein (UPF0148 family)
MMVAQACPRCRGTLTRVEDVGDVYYSCVQCGHVAYGRLPAATPMTPSENWQVAEAADRGAVRRRQLRRDRERAARQKAA